jgi:hypothetical protein
VLDAARDHDHLAARKLHGTVGGASWPGPSEYERIAAVVGDVPLADASDDVVEFLACSRDIPASTMELMRASARLARDHHVSPELLFALGSQHMPVNLRSMLRATAAQLRVAATRAIDANQVPRRLAGDLPAHQRCMARWWPTP